MLGCNEKRSNGRNSQVFGQAMKKRPTGHTIWPENATRKSLYSVANPFTCTIYGVVSGCGQIAIYLVVEGGGDVSSAFSEEESGHVEQPTCSLGGASTMCNTALEHLAPAPAVREGGCGC